MGKKTPKAPTPPDPYATAAAQTQSNKDTAVANANLNRINQYAPEGALEYRQIGTNSDGTPKYASYQTYSPEQQTLYENQNKVSNALSDLSLANVGRVADAQSKPFNYDNMTGLQTSIPGAGQGVQSGYDTGGNVKYNFDSGGNIQKQIGDAGNIQDTYASGGNIQRGLDYSGLDKIPGIGDYGAEAQRVQDSVYKQATSRLDPQWEQQQRQLASTLAAKGVSENSEAYRRAMDQAQRQKTDAYNQATYSGIQAGSQEQSRLFGLALSGRQEGVNEINTQGTFANSAQSQAEAQNAARAGFGNTAQGQRFDQMAQQGAFANMSQQQQYEQNQGQADFYNQAQYQQNSQNAAQAAFGNQAQGQIFGQNQANANFNNSGRQQQIQEATYLRNLPLNEISALTGAAGGVSQPQFADYSNANVAGTDYSGIIQNNFANQQAIYQQKMQAKNAALGAIFGAVGSAGGAAIAASDRRLKANIQEIGKLANGLKTYVFNYIGSAKKRFGVMADEVIKVIPDAIIHSNGYMMVDYRKVWNNGRSI